MNVSARNILTGVATALAVSFLLYTFNTFVTDLFKRFDVSFQRTAILGNEGYVLQIDNPTSAALDKVIVGIGRQSTIDGTSADNGVEIQIKRATTFTTLTLTGLPPNRRTNLFIRTKDEVQQADITVIYNGSAYYVDDKNYEQLSFFNRSNFINAIVLFAVYALVTLWGTSKANDLRQRIEEMESRTKEQIGKSDARVNELSAQLSTFHSTQLRVKLILQRRISDLTAETELWRKFFISIYTSLFSSSSKDQAQTAMRAILERSGLKMSKGRRLDEIPEEMFIEMLFDKEFAQRAGG